MCICSKILKVRFQQILALSCDNCRRKILLAIVPHVVPARCGATCDRHEVPARCGAICEGLASYSEYYFIHLITL